MRGLNTNYKLQIDIALCPQGSYITAHLTQKDSIGTIAKAARTMDVVLETDVLVIGSPVGGLAVALAAGIIR